MGALPTTTYACNDLRYWGTEDRILCQLFIVLLKCLWAPSLGRGATEEEQGDSDSSQGIHGLQGVR